MRFRCDNCGAQYAIADEKLGKKGVRVRCKKCGEVITVRPPSAEQEAAPAEDPAPEQPTGPAEEERERTAVDSPPAQEAAGDAAGFNLGEDDELKSALDNILGDEGSEDEARLDDGEQEQDEDYDRQATRVFNVEEMQQVQAEREQASREEPENESESVAFGTAAREQAPEAQPSAAGEVDRDRVEWYAAVDDQQVGPLSINELAERWAAGEFNTETLVWKSGFEDWLAVFDVPELAFLAEEGESEPEESGWAGRSGDWDQPGDGSYQGEADEDRNGFGAQDEEDYDSQSAGDQDAGQEDEGGYYDDEDEASSSASADAFAGADVDWKPSALSSLSDLAEEELASLRPEEPEEEEEELPFGSEEGLPAADEPGLAEGPMEDGDSSLISQIAAEEEAAARRAEQEREEQERQAEELRRKEEESALAAQEAARREKIEEQRERAAPPEEKYIPARAPLPRWAIGLMIGGGFLVLVLVGFLGFAIYRLTSGPEQAVQPGPQQLTQPVQAPPGQVPPGSNQAPAAQPAPQPGVQPGAQTPAGSAAQAGTDPAGQPAKADGDPEVAVAGARPDAKKPGPPEAKPPAASPPKAREEKRPPPTRHRRRTEHKPRRVEPTPPPKPDPPKETKPVRHKPKSGILDFEDPDDRAFAREAGITAKAPVAKVEKKKELPPLSNADVLGVMKRHLAEFKACNRKQKEIDSSVSGKMVINFSIANNGRVSQVSISRKTAAFSKTYVAGCIQGIIKRLKFPEFGGPPKKIPFPFTVN